VTARWQLLFWAALLSLVGVSWLAHDWGISLWSWLNVQLVGMIGASGFAFFALATRARVKWPAAAALVCASPMTVEMLRAATAIAPILAELGLPGILIVIGPLLTTTTAIWILVRSVPPPREDRIARAEIR